MIRESVAALGGVLSGLAAFFFVLFYSGLTNSIAPTNTGFYRQLPIVTPAVGSANESFNFGGVSGIYSGVLPALVLMLLALGAGIVTSYLAGKLKGEEFS